MTKIEIKVLNLTRFAIESQNRSHICDRFNNSIANFVIEFVTGFLIANL